MSLDNKLALLCSILQYQFQNIELLKLALTHRSAARNHNERLEFLGDSLLNFVIAEALFQRFPNASEGQLSRQRASLVNSESLVVLAKQFNLGTYLQLGTGELKSGGRKRHSILADAMEAVIGAVYLDSGFDSCRKQILLWYQQQLNDTTLNSDRRDAKTALQEYLQAKQLELPHYELIRAEGDEHQRRFFVKCWVSAFDYNCEGDGRNRRSAEQAAARKMLKYIESQES
ncbi:MAG: ribonuclease III [Gammaproteobacteria bacterium]